MLQNVAEEVPRDACPQTPLETFGLRFSTLATPLNCSTHLHQWYALLVHCPQRIHQSHLVPHWNLHPLPAVRPMHMHDNKLPSLLLQIYGPHKLGLSIIHRHTEPCGSSIYISIRLLCHTTWFECWFLIYSLSTSSSPLDLWRPAIPELRVSLNT